MIEGCFHQKRTSQMVSIGILIVPNVKIFWELQEIAFYTILLPHGYIFLDI